MQIHNAAVTGSFTYNGIDISDITGSEQSVVSLNEFSASILNYTSSNNQSVATLQGATASLQGATSSLFAYTASNSANVATLFATSASLNAAVTQIYNATASLYAATASIYNATASIYGATSSLFNYSASSNLRIGSLEQYTASLNTRSASFACVNATNTFACAQYFSNTSNAISFSSTGSLYSDGGMRLTKDLYVSGTSYFNNVTVFGTQSINYITSSQLNIASNLITVNTSTPAVRFGGLAVYDSGSLGTGLTGSILWDSENNHWVYSNPSGSSYSGGMFISGPRSAALGSEQGTTACALMMGQGGDHITSSAVFHYGNATCFYGNSFISSTGSVCFQSNATIGGNLNIGNSSTTSSIAVIGTPVGGFSTGYIYWGKGSQTTAGLYIESPGTNIEVVTGYNERIALSTGIGLQVYTNNGSGTYTSRFLLDRSGNGCIFGDFQVGGIYRDFAGEALLQTQTNCVTLIGTSGAGAAGRALNFLAGNVSRLCIATTGVATFTCQVCAPSFIGISATANSGSPNAIVAYSGNDCSAIWRGAISLIHNPDVAISAGSSIGITLNPLSSTGSSFYGTAAIKAVRENATANNQDTALAFWTRSGASNSTTDTEKMRITSAGVACFASIICSVGLQSSDSLIIRKDASVDNRYIQLCNTQTGGYRWDLVTRSTAQGCGFGILNNTTSQYALLFDANNIGVFACQLCSPSFRGGSNSNTLNALSGLNASTAQATIYSYNYCAAGFSIYSAQGLNYFAGNVGINHDAPSAKLQICCFNTWGSQTNESINIVNGGTGGDINVQHNMGAISWYSGAVLTAAITAWRNTPASGNNVDLAFASSAGGVQYERMRIYSTGVTTFACNICVGKYLTVGSQGGSDVAFIGGGAGVGATLQLKYADGATKVSLNGNNPSYFLYDVGIGTANPASRLTLAPPNCVNSSTIEFTNTDNAVISSYYSLVLAVNNSNTQTGRSITLAGGNRGYGNQCSIMAAFDADSKLATFYGAVAQKSHNYHTVGQWYKIPFYMEKGTGTSIATTQCLIVINNNDSFQEMHFTIEYGSRLQGVSDSYTQTSLRTYGVNRFVGNTATITDTYLITGGSGCNINTHAPMSVAIVGNCMTVVKVDFSSSLGGSSFVWGEVRIWSIEPLAGKITISNNNY